MNTESTDTNRESKLGRPRSPEVHASILEATIEILRSEGYARLSIEGVARKAGVGKATIYRWWTGKGHLVYEAVFTKAGNITLPDTGNIEDDLRILITLLLDEFSAPEASAAILGILNDFSKDSELRELIREQFLIPEREFIGSVLTRARDRGEIRPDASVNLILDSLVGAVFYRVVVIGETPTIEIVDELVNLVMKGIGKP